MNVTASEASTWLREAVELRRDHTVAVALHEVAQWFGLTQVRTSKFVYGQVAQIRPEESARFRDLYVLFLRAEAARRVREAQDLDRKATALDARAARLRERRAAFRAPDAA